MRTINKTLLRKLTRSIKGGRSALARACGCSLHAVSNWLRADYDYGLQEYHAIAAAEFFKRNIDELFPMRDAVPKSPAQAQHIL